MWSRCRDIGSVPELTKFDTSRSRSRSAVVTTSDSERTRDRSRSGCTGRGGGRAAAPCQLQAQTAVECQAQPQPHPFVLFGTFVRFRQLLLQRSYLGLQHRDPIHLSLLLRRQRRVRFRCPLFLSLLELFLCVSNLLLQRADRILRRRGSWRLGSLGSWRSCSLLDAALADC